ncbi:MAG TPA: hypothetical protein PK198_10900, partial [Saprospiraceae bacterium]|nr:hypothetical protein [Saprospiraceae bacterium]
RKESVLTLFDFKEKLSEIGHFPSVYENEKDLVFQFLEQLEKSDNAGFFPKNEAETRTDISHLPDLQPHFTAREQELALLDAAWADPQTNLLQFVAPGGTGKTMLLTYWLHHYLPESKAERPAACAGSAACSSSTARSRCNTRPAPPADWAANSKTSH